MMEFLLENHELLEVESTKSSYHYLLNFNCSCDLLQNYAALPTLTCSISAPIFAM